MSFLLHRYCQAGVRIWARDSCNEKLRFFQLHHRKVQKESHKLRPSHFQQFWILFKKFKYDYVLESKIRSIWYFYLKNSENYSKNRWIFFSIVTYIKAKQFWPLGWFWIVIRIKLKLKFDRFSIVKMSNFAFNRILMTIQKHS